MLLALAVKCFEHDLSVLVHAVHGAWLRLKSLGIEPPTRVQLAEAALQRQLAVVPCVARRRCTRCCGSLRREGVDGESVATFHDAPPRIHG